MSEKFQENVTVVSQKQIADGIFDLVLQTKEIAAHAKPGQFVSVYSNDASKLLPRPISLCGIDREAGTLRLVYRVTGEKTGTEEVSKLEAGDTIKIMGPLGNGFAVESGKKAFLIGGGIGVPPMLQLAKEIKASGVAEFQTIMGYRNAQTFLLFSQLSTFRALLFENRELEDKENYNSYTRSDGTSIRSEAKVSC